MYHKSWILGKKPELRWSISSFFSVFFKVPGAGLEPARPNEHMPLKHACLPISAPGLIWRCKSNFFFITKKIIVIF